MKKFAVKEHNGIPTLFIDGKAVPALAFWFPKVQPQYIESFAKYGINIFSFPLSLKECWKGPDKFDFSEIDRRINTVLDKVPGALIIPRISLNAAEWWENANPGELNKYEDGSAWKQSISSEKWKTETAAALARYICHLKESTFAQNILAYHICAGGCGEWFNWGVCAEKVPGFDEASLSAFKKYVMGKYNNQDELQAAWKDEKITFANISVPSFQERLKTTKGLFKDPSREGQKVIDFFEFFSESVTDAILYFADTIKKTAGPDALCGVFYGYTMIWGVFGRLYEYPHSGHMALSKALNSDLIDFMASPYSYEDRAAGGDCAFQTLVDSIRMHGKLFFLELDHRTCLSEASAGFGRSSNMFETINILKRDFSRTLTKGIGAWWMEMCDCGGWYDSPEIMETISRMQNISKESLARKRNSISEVAVIVDEKSFAHFSIGSTLTRSMVCKEVPYGLSRCGAAVDFYLLEDLVKMQLTDYKCYIFLIGFKLTAEEKAFIKKNLMQDNKYIIWTYGCGYSDGETASLENMSDAIGINIECLPLESSIKKSDLDVAICNEEHPMTRGLPAGMRFGTTELASPVFFCNDPKAVVLGKTTLHGNPLFCVKDCKNWKSIYIGAPMIPSSIFRNIFKEAGVHIYNDENDIFYVDGSYLAIHAASRGKRKIRLPRKALVQELFENETVCDEESEIKVDLQKWETKLYSIHYKESAES